MLEISVEDVKIVKTQNGPATPNSRPRFKKWLEIDITQADCDNLLKELVDSEMPIEDKEVHQIVKESIEAKKLENANKPAKAEANKRSVNPADFDTDPYEEKRIAAKRYREAKIKRRTKSLMKQMFNFGYEPDDIESTARNPAVRNALGGGGGRTTMCLRAPMSMDN